MMEVPMHALYVNGRYRSDSGEFTLILFPTLAIKAYTTVREQPPFVHLH